MGLDMYLGRYHKANLEKTIFNVEETKELKDWEGRYTVFDKICPEPFKDIATEVKVVNQYYNMEKISEDFADGNPLTIGGCGGGNIYFRNYEKGIRLDIPFETIDNGYLIDKEETAYVIEGDYEVAYWRKANQIRQWFVNHIEEFDENDNGEYFTVTKELLERLIMDCYCVLASQEVIEVDEKIKKKIEKVRALAERGVGGEKDGAKDTLEKMERKYGLTGVKVRPEDILPTSSGFFFGSTEYDEWYYRDLENTIEQCQKVIDETDWENEVVVYHESW